MKGKTENVKSRRQTFSFYPSDEVHNQLMDLTLSVKTVLKDLGLSDYSDTFNKEEVSYTAHQFVPSYSYSKTLTDQFSSIFHTF